MRLSRQDGTRDQQNPLGGLQAPGAGSRITYAPTTLSAAATNAIPFPVYSPLLSVVIDKKRADTLLAVQFNAACLWTGPAGGLAPNFRLRLDGGQLITVGSGTIYNESVGNRIQPVGYSHPGVSGVSAGDHTVLVEWGYYGAGGRTLSINPAILGGDAQFAHLTLYEVEP